MDVKLINKEKEPEAEICVVDQDNVKIKLCAKTEQAEIDKIQRSRDFDVFTLIL